MIAIAAVVAMMTGLLLISGGQVSAQSTIRWVNDDDPNGGGYSPPGTSCDDPGYSTIQDAVNAASPGDIIKVCPGTYNENVVITSVKNSIMLVSTGGPSVTTVNAVVSEFVFWVSSHNVTLDGFTIVPAGSTGDHDLGVFVDLWGNSIVHNVIPGGRIGIALGCTSFGNTVAHNVITGIPAFGDTAAINIDTCEAPPFPGSDDNSIHHNIACGGVGNRSIATGGGSSGNVIHNNIATGIRIADPGNVVHHNTVKALLDIEPGNVAHHNTIDPNVCP
jgi:hypothetical protein